jgi:hypothetical protein
MTVQVTINRPDNGQVVVLGAGGNLQAQGTIDENVNTLISVLQNTATGLSIQPTGGPQQNVPAGNWTFNFSGVRQGHYSLTVSGTNRNGTGSSGVTFTVGAGQPLAGETASRRGEAAATADGTGSRQEAEEQPASR